MQTLNGIQTISVIGIFFSLFCQFIMLIIDKDVENMWKLYPTWAILFVVGTLMRYIDTDSHEHHHH